MRRTSRIQAGFGMYWVAKLAASVSSLSSLSCCPMSVMGEFARKVPSSPLRPALTLQLPWLGKRKMAELTSKAKSLGREHNNSSAMQLHALPPPD
jgi:hypothetical protein